MCGGTSPGRFLRTRSSSCRTNNGATWSSNLTADSGFISLVTNGIGTLLVIRKPEHWVYRSTNAGCATWIRVAGGPAADRARFAPLLWQIPLRSP